MPAKSIINYQSPSPIRCIYIGDEEKAINYANQLKACGYLVMTAMYPTVAKGKSMFRIALSAIHTRKEIDGLCKNLKVILNGH